MRILRVAAPALLVATLALTLTACDPGGGPAETPLPTVSVTPEVSPTPSAEPGPGAFVATCENLLSTSLTEYTTGGLSVEGPGDYEEKLQSEGNAFAAFYDAGGVFCIVSGGMEAYALYGWAPFDDAGWEPIRTANLAEGWSEETTDAGFLMRSPYEQPLMVCYYRPGEFGACAVSDDVLDEIIGNATA
jgi:hypothetical protein